jgi:hypothetical protein
MNAMQAAWDWAKAYFSDMDKDECLQWKNRLMHQARFILVDLEKAGVDRYLTFDAINSRGLPLSQFDKIKNFCILINKHRGLGEAPESTWYRSIQLLESYGVGQRSTEEAFITELFNVFHTARISQGDVHQKFVERYRALIEGPDPVLEGQFVAFIKLWESYAASFGLLASKSQVKRKHYGTKCSSGSGNWLDRLDNMDLPTITRPLLVAGHIELDDTEFEELARACEIYTFRLHAVLGRRKDMNAIGIITLANQVLIHGEPIGKVLSQLCTWLGSWASLDKVVGFLANGEPKYHFDNSVSGWAYCYYFLYEYEVHVSPLGVSGLAWGDNNQAKINSQEHILPQKHRDGGWWQAEWPDELSAERAKHRLGNLVMTSGNAILGRKSIDKKLDDSTAAYSYNCADATNSEKLIVSFTDGTSWKLENILKRELAILEFAANRWSIPCCLDNGNVYLPDSFKVIEADHLTIDHSDCIGEVETEEEYMNDGEIDAEEV